MEIFVFGWWEKRFLYLEDRERNFLWRWAVEIFVHVGQENFFFFLGRQGKRFLVLGNSKRDFSFLVTRKKIFALWRHGKILLKCKEKKKTITFFYNLVSYYKNLKKLISFWKIFSNLGLNFIYVFIFHTIDFFCFSF